MKRNKQFVLMDAYDYAVDRIVARLVAHIIDEGETMCFEVERYYKLEEGRYAPRIEYLDPEYYNPIEFKVYRDYACAFHGLENMIGEYRNETNISEVEIR